MDFGREGHPRAARSPHPRHQLVLRQRGPHKAPRVPSPISAPSQGGPARGPPSPGQPAAPSLAVPKAGTAPLAPPPPDVPVSSLSPHSHSITPWMERVRPPGPGGSVAPAQALGRPLCSLVFVIGSLRGHRASLKEDLSGQEASKTAKKKPGVDEGLPRRGLSSLPCPPPPEPRGPLTIKTQWERPTLQPGKWGPGGTRPGPG